jgi:ParB family chromosome partitioning protein
MSKKKRFGVSEALTRGLSETINVVENHTGLFRHVVLPLSRIELDPDNPRKLAITLMDVRQGLSKTDPDFTRKLTELEKLQELAATITSSGIINPIVVYKLGEVYRVVAGERRCLASILAGKQEIDARVFTEKPQGFDLKLVQWIENTAREDLTLHERMNNIRDIVREYQNQYGTVSVTPTLLREITGLSLAQTTYYDAVLKAPPDVRQMIENGKIRSLDKAAVVTGIVSPELRGIALAACADGCSLKELRKIANQSKHPPKKPLALLPAKRGRAVTRVNLGSTLKTRVVQTIAMAVVGQAKYAAYSDMFTRVNWGHFDEAARAFRKLVEIMERDTAR